MNKKNIENKINESFVNATPRVYNSISNDVAHMDVDRTKRRSVTPKTIFWKLATGLLSLVLVVMAIVGVVGNVNQTAQASTVSLDVNPSVEIILNRNNRVVKVNPLNDDGKAIVSDMDFNGCQLKVAVNALIGSMIRNGYLSAEANSVLVSVDSSKNAYQSIAEAVANEITLTLGQMSIDASVVSQWIKSDDQIAAIAKENNVSLGKAQLIYKISTQSDYTVAQLVELPINDLSVLLSELNIVVDDVEQTGSASKETYVGDDAAKEIALSLAEEGLTADNASLSKVKCKLDFEDGLIMYEVEFVYGNYAYEVDVAAKDGTVIELSKELITKYTPAADELTKEQVIDIAYQLAGITESDVDGELYCHQSRYYRTTVYEICFRSETKYFEFEIANDGEVLYQGFELLKVDAINSYLARKDVDKWFFENNGTFTILDRDKLDYYRVTAQKTNDGLTYTVQFVYNGQQYTYNIDAVTKAISKPQIEERDDAIKNDVKDKLHGIFGFDDRFGFDKDFDDMWNDWDWDDDDDFEWEFDWDGEHYEVEIDRWGNVYWDFEYPQRHSHF